MVICRIHLTELGFAAFLFFTGCYDFMYGKHNYFIYIFLQTITFLIVGFGYVGTIVPSSWRWCMDWNRKKKKERKKAKAYIFLLFPYLKLFTVYTIFRVIDKTNTCPCRLRKGRGKRLEFLVGCLWKFLRRHKKN